MQTRPIGQRCNLSVWRLCVYAFVRECARSFGPECVLSVVFCVFHNCGGGGSGVAVVVMVVAAVVVSIIILLFA